MLTVTTKVGNSTKIDIQKQIVDLLKKHNFKEADLMFNKHWDYYGFNIKKYEEYKALYLANYFNDNFKLKFWYDKEQLEAIASIHKNTLITARAGSGKTQVIAWKTAYLLDNEKLDSSDIVLLSFNKKAATEINKRIVNFWNISKHNNPNLLNFNNSITFHSLAYKILWNDIKDFKILTDSKKITDTKTWVEKEFKTNKQLQFIQNCFYDIYQWNIKELMEKELSNELVYFKHSSYLDDDDKYYEYRKNKEYLAFSWNYIRSKWEKILIDFLFEHWFDIDYEPYIDIWWNYLSKPDIRCNIKLNWKNLLSRDIIIEHWGFDKKDCFKKLPIWKHISGAKYAEIRKKKVEYWTKEEQKWNYYFIQTTAKEVFENRKHFLEHFKSQIVSILTKENIEFRKLEKEIIIEHLRKNEKFIFPFTKKLEHFINKSQQKHYSPIDIEDKIRSISDNEERAFIIIANRVYKKYELEKEKQKYIDFNQILKLASEKLEKNKCDIDLWVWSNKINLKYIKHLIIDEYQDFSTLFYNILNIIIKYNKKCKLFVVWDSWQSINAFAGSELWYFFDFKKFYELTTIKKISTNYRSKQSIVEMWNNLMKLEWNWKANWLEWVNDWWEPYIYKDINKFPLCNNTRINNIFNKWEDKKSLEQAKYVFQSIIDIINSNKGKTIMIISRNNRVFWYELVDWKMKLYSYYFKLLITNSNIDIDKNPSNIEEFLDSLDIDNYTKLSNLFENNLEFITAHKSKWKEADIIIMLDIEEKKFPSNSTSLKSDVKYDRLFWITPESLLKDERRLFYVAITRAKEKIHILSNWKKDTWLLKELNF